MTADWKSFNEIQGFEAGGLFRLKPLFTPGRYFLVTDIDSKRGFALTLDLFTGFGGGDKLAPGSCSQPLDASIVELVVGDQREALLKRYKAQLDADVAQRQDDLEQVVAVRDFVDSLGTKQELTQPQQEPL